MTPPIKTTSVDVKFYNPYSSTTPLPNYGATLIDNRSVFHIYSDHNVATTKMFVKIDSADKTTANLKPFEIQPGKMTIGSQNESDICDATYPFQHGELYSLKIYIVNNDQTIRGKFSHGDVSQVEYQNQPAYSYRYRADIDYFENDASSNNVSMVTNVEEVENGGQLKIKCPLTPLDSADSRRPHTVRFMFDEKDDYPGLTNYNNYDALQSWFAAVDYKPVEDETSADYGMYTLDNVGLANDGLYQVNVVGLYSDGHVVSHTLPNMLPVIARPVIQKITAYGLDSTKSGSGDPTISTVAEIVIQEDTAAKKIGAANNYSGGVNNPLNNSILFQFKQGNTIYYEVRFAIQSGTYTIHREDLGPLMSSNPQKESNGNYKFDVVAVIEYVNPNNPTDTSGNIIKTSLPVEAVFTQDVNQLPSFSIQNAWVSAAVTSVGGSRMVDLTNALSNTGYTVAPESGIVGSFNKHAFYGSGVTDGIFKDLDTADTKHKFQLIKYDPNNGNILSTAPVTQLVQMQGRVNNPSAIQTQQEYVDLLNTESGPGIYVLNNVRSVLTNTQMGINDGISGNSNRGIFADSNRGILALDAVNGGINVMNTGKGTDGAASGSYPKMIAYYYANQLYVNQTPLLQNSTNSFTLNDITGLGIYAVIEQKAGAKDYPYFQVYTSPTASGNLGASFYKSRVIVGPETYPAGDTSDASKVGLTLLYTGTDDGSFLSYIPTGRRIKFELKPSSPATVANPGYMSELIASITLQTSSVIGLPNDSPGYYNFRLIEAGAVTSHASTGKTSMAFNRVIPPVLTSSDGLFPNIPGQAGVTGTNQPPIYFWVPQAANLYSQTDYVKLSIQLVGPNGEVTIPDATLSQNQLYVVNKVNRYEMEIGTDSEPQYVGNDQGGLLEIPINNPTALPNGDFYFTSATFTSSTTTPSPVTEALTAQADNPDGVFNLTVLNPHPRGNCTYTVHYNIADPNGTMIRGPLSLPYTIPIENTPTNDNFDLGSSYSYTTFNGSGKSEFSFTIQFIDTQEKSIDGVNIYFESASDFVNGGSAVTSLFHLLDVARDRTKSTQTVTYTLQSTDPLTSGVNDGVKIIGSSGESSAMWKNYGAGKIVFEPYITPDVTSTNRDQLKFPNFSSRKDINNIPVISKVENIVLNGGVLELYNASYMSFDNAVSMYHGVSNVTASYVLTVNTQDQSSSIVPMSTSTHMYEIGLGSTPSNYTLNLKVKLVTSNDDSSYESESATLIFDSASVDVSTMTVDVRRNSNSSSLYVVRGNYTVSPSSAEGSSGYLNVKEVKLVNNSQKDNVDPALASVLSWTGTGDVQPTGSNQNPNAYSVSTYNLSDKLYLQYRVKAGVDYTLQYTSESSANTYESVSDLVTLKAHPSNNVFVYTVAVRPEVTILSSNVELDSSSNMKLRMKINAKGLDAEGLQSMFVLLGQDGDYTNANDVNSGSGCQIALSFTAANLTNAYDGDISSSDLAQNITTNKSYTLTVTDVPGLDEGSGLGATTWTLQVGSLDGSDESVLTFPALSSGNYGGFVSTKEINVVAVGSTRLGVDVDIKKLLGSP